jgi:hypothetical protein
MLTQERLKELSSYGSDGEFRRELPNRRGKVGDVMGCINSGGRKVIRIDGRMYYASRLAFLYMTGSFPTYEVDHIDRDRLNNRWENLREATRSQNCGNKSGGGRLSKLSPLPKGVCRQGSRTFGARITKGGARNVWLGTFDTVAEAAAAYIAAAQARYGEFASAS